MGKVNLPQNIDNLPWNGPEVIENLRYTNTHRHLLYIIVAKPLLGHLRWEQDIFYWEGGDTLPQNNCKTFPGPIRCFTEGEVY